MLKDIASPVEEREDARVTPETIRERSEEVIQRVIDAIAEDAREDAEQYLDEVVTPHGGE